MSPSRPVSATFLETIRGSHSMLARARVVNPGKKGLSPTGTEVAIIAGDVDIDGTAQVRSTVEITTSGEGMWPMQPDDLLAPYGKELFVERGVAYGNGREEWCSLGYFGIRTIEQADPPNGPIRVSGKDRMQGIIDARLVAPRQYPPSATYGSVMSQLIQEVFPSATIAWLPAGIESSAIGRSLIVEEKRFEFLDDLVKSVGRIWYWDYRGFLTIRTPQPPTQPVWDVNSGEGGVLVTMKRQLSREGVYNAVVATGEATGSEEPVRAVAFDDNPQSPTYYSGLFGPVPKYFSSPFIRTPLQAEDAARALLRKEIGLPYNVDFSAVPNPALEPGDPVRVKYSNGVGAEVHTLEKVRIPLSEQGALTADTKEKTTVLIGAVSS